MYQDCFDVAIVGGGIIGIATAHALSQRFRARLVLLEAEDRLAAHQTGRNSGVIHSGIFYRPGSQKAELCTVGRRSLYQFCRDHDIEFKQCGKIIVAAHPGEENRLQHLFDCGTANGLQGLKLLDRQQIKTIEPHAGGMAALFVPQAGIVDFAMVARMLAQLAVKNGCEIRLNSRLQQLENDGGEQLGLVTSSGPIRVRYLINCGGLYADRIAALCGVESDVQIIPFRGDYFSMSNEASRLVKGLIYPVPDPALPFLGVHLTSKLDGSVEVGPNALFASGRNAYHGFRWRHFDELASSLTFPGFWKLALRHWKAGLHEIYRSINTHAMLSDIQKLVPAVERKHIRRSHSGIRAQAVSRTGELLDDFLIEGGVNSIHVLNAPSPAATASLAIGQFLTDIADSQFDLLRK